MTQVNKQNKQTGFTLIELLIASGIFVMVSLLGYAAVSSVTDVEGYTGAQRNLSESAALSLETIAREIRFATGNPERGIDPVQITTSSSAELTINSFGLPADGDGVIVTTIDSATGDEKVFALRRVVTESGVGQIVREDCLDNSCVLRAEASALTSETVDVKLLVFSTIASADSQIRHPFIQIQAEFEARTSRGETLSETVRTLVSNRVYQD